MSDRAIGTAAAWVSATTRATMPRWASKSWAISRLIAWRSMKSRALSAQPSAISRSTPRSAAECIERRRDRWDGGAASLRRSSPHRARACSSRCAGKSARRASAGTPAFSSSIAAHPRSSCARRRQRHRKRGLDGVEAVAIAPIRSSRPSLKFFMAQEPDRRPAQQALQHRDRGGSGRVPGMLAIERIDQLVAMSRKPKLSRATAKAAAMSADAAHRSRPPSARRRLGPPRLIMLLASMVAMISRRRRCDCRSRSRNAPAWLGEIAQELARQIGIVGNAAATISSCSAILA